jgi:hypothetical protein
LERRLAAGLTRYFTPQNRSPDFNLLYRGFATRGATNFQLPADFKSAIRQVANLRYDWAASALRGETVKYRFKLFAFCATEIKAG